jgi:predicted enzyme related to lactoylglutathione lyase
VDAAAERMKALGGTVHARASGRRLGEGLGVLRELFSWQKVGADTGAMGTYQLFSAGGETIGGMFTKPSTAPVPFWLIGDIDVAMRCVKARGGEILDSPMEVPGDRWIVRCTDPQGAIFALVGKLSHHGIGYFERVASREPSVVRSGLRR